MEGQKNYSKKSEVISASEIGQYHYCSIAWYLQRCGFVPKSEFLDIGLKKHKELGRIIDEIDYKTRISNTYKIIGLLFLIIMLFIFLYEVIL